MGTPQPDLPGIEVKTSVQRKYSYEDYEDRDEVDFDSYFEEVEKRYFPIPIDCADDSDDSEEDDAAVHSLYTETDDATLNAHDDQFPKQNETATKKDLFIHSGADDDLLDVKDPHGDQPRDEKEPVAKSALSSEALEDTVPDVKDDKDDQPRKSKSKQRLERIRPLKQIELDVEGGPQKFCYCIATPTNPDAEIIDENLPVILFLHSVFIAQEVFKPQFEDRRLRRFNLVSLDFRGHGFTEGDVPEDYDQEMAARDVICFMDALKLPACHIFALSMGTIIGLQLAVFRPDKVLSLCFVSPICLEELPEIGGGREEISEAWIDGAKEASQRQKPGETWKDAALALFLFEKDSSLAHAVMGGTQLAFSNIEDPMVQGYIRYCIERQCFVNWTPNKESSYRITTCDFLTKRKAQSIEDLESSIAKKNIPVELIHCKYDVYEVPYAERFRAQLESAKVNVKLEFFSDGCHFGSLEHAEKINPVFYDFIMELVGEAQLAPIPTGEITTAWDKDLKAAEDLAEELLKDQLARQGRVLRCEPGAGLQIRSPPPDL